MEIVWSRLGERLFKSVLDYVEDNFGENVARQTFHRITEKVEQLKYFPGIGVKDFELAESLGIALHGIVLHDYSRWFRSERSEVSGIFIQ